MGSYGNCPICGEPGISRERRPDGNDRCAAGHTYKSADAVQPTAVASEVGVDIAVKIDGIEVVSHPNGGLSIVTGEHSRPLAIQPEKVDALCRCMAGAIEARGITVSFAGMLAARSEGGGS